MQRYIAIKVLVLLIAGFATRAESRPERTWQISLETGVQTEYADRGATVGGDHIKTALGVSDGRLSVGVSYTRMLAHNRLVYDDEIDINLDYGLKTGSGIHLNLGADLIHNPVHGSLLDLGAHKASTIETYVSVGFEELLNPQFTAYFDIHLHDFVLEMALAPSYPLSGRSSLDVKLMAGGAFLHSAQDNLYISAGLGYHYALSDKLNIHLSVNSGLSSQKTFTDTAWNHSGEVSVHNDHKSFWAGIGISRDF